MKKLLYCCLVAVSFCTLGAGPCDPYRESVQKIAEAIPPARIPKILNTEGLVQWPNESVYYVTGRLATNSTSARLTEFVLNVQHTPLNELIIKENGAVMSNRTNLAGIPNTDAYPFYVVEDLPSDASNQNKKIHISHLDDPGVNGKELTYSLSEKSSNQKYQGTPDAISAPVDIKVVVITQNPEIAAFSAPASVMKGNAYTVTWIVNNAKKVEFLKDGQQLEPPDVSNQYASNYSKSKTFTMDGTTTFTVRAYNALNGGKQEQARTVSLAMPPPPAAGPTDTYIPGYMYLGIPGCATNDRVDHLTAYIQYDDQIGWYCCEDAKGAPRTICGPDKWKFEPDCIALDGQLIQPRGCYKKKMNP